MSVAVTRPDGRPSLRLVSGGARPLRVAVLGGGISGLAAAHFLAKAGHRPVVLESSYQLGGVELDFEHLGIRLDRRPNVLRSGDAELLALVVDLGLADQLVWGDTATGAIIGGMLYGFDTPIDVFRIRTVSAADRLRAGLATLYVAALMRGGPELDDVLAVDWLRALFGSRVFESLWVPLLRARFGVRSGELPAYWVWHRLRRGWRGARDSGGTLRCGQHGLMTALRGAIVRRGGQLRLGSPVDTVEETAAGMLVGTSGGSERFDAVLSTLRPARLANVARGTLIGALPCSDLRYRGEVSALVVTRRRLERFYGTLVADPRCAFQSVVETTNVIPPDWLGGRHLVYVASYCGAESEAYERSDDVVAGQAMAGLGAVYPAFRRRDVEGVYVFRASHVEPVWTMGALGRRPAPRVGRSCLYVCTAAQGYPQANGWNTGVRLAAQAVNALLDDLARPRVAVA